MSSAEAAYKGTIVRLATPAASLLAASAASSQYLSTRLQLEPSPTFPHASILLAIACVLYGGTALISGANSSLQARRIAIFVIAFIVLFLIITFYLALWLSVIFLGELPARDLVVSYLDELPTLAASLPVTGPTLALLGSSMLVIIVATASFLAMSLVAGVPLMSAWICGARARLGARIISYGGILYLLISFGTPLDWQYASREPMTGSWHNARLVSNSMERQRNPRESAYDRELEKSYAGLTAERKPNIILIYIDALRADVTQPYGGERPNMPFIQGLVARGELKQAEFGLASCPATICGLAAILQSRPTWLQSPENFSLPKLLKQQGYKIGYVLSSNHQGYFDLKKYYEPYDFYFDGKQFGPRESSNDYRLLDGLAQLGHWKGDPTFLLIGLVSPHPLAYRRESNRVFRPDRAAFTNTADDFRAAYRNNYDNGVLQADDVLRRVWAWLGDSGYLQDAEVIITSDHGESIGERGSYGHAKTLDTSELRIPVWLSDRRGDLRNLELVRQIDLAPTVVSRLGLPVPASWKGRSLTVGGPAEWSEHYLPTQRNRIAIVHYQVGLTVKYILDRKSMEEKAFDLINDPQESKNILDELPKRRIDAIRQRASLALLAK